MKTNIMMTLLLSLTSSFALSQSDKCNIQVPNRKLGQIERQIIENKGYKIVQPSDQQVLTLSYSGGQPEVWGRWDDIILPGLRVSTIVKLYRSNDLSDENLIFSKEEDFRTSFPEIESTASQDDESKAFHRAHEKAAQKALIMNLPRCF